MMELAIIASAQAERNRALAEASRRAYASHAEMWFRLHSGTVRQVVAQPKRTHCPSCGAPAEPVKCSYCGMLSQ